MGIALILIAACMAGTSNFFLRKSIDAGGTTKAYLTIQLGLSFLLAVFLNPVRTGEYAWSTPTAYIGIAGGLILGVMMYLLGKALENGPPGLTFAVLNSSSVMPAVVMAVLFGSMFGHEYHPWNAIGSILVVVGLFWAGWRAETVNNRLRFWLLLALGAFFAHILFLIFMQWRAMLLKPDLPDNLLLSFRVDESASQWFMPMIYLAAALFQLIIFICFERRIPNRKEVLYGVAGGIAIGLSTFFLIKATEIASAWENAMLFPIYSVTIIVLCNLWGQLLYKERVNWLANSVCLIGLVCGTVNWSTFF